MNWHIQAYTTDVGGYFVSLRGVLDWIVIDPTGTVYDGFTDENAAMAFAEYLYAAKAAPVPDSTVNPTATSVSLA